MPDPEEDVTRDSSTASEQTTPDTSTAASDTQPVDTTPEAAATDKAVETTDQSDEPSSKSAIKFFSGDKTDKSKDGEKKEVVKTDPTKQPADATKDAKPADKKLSKDELFPELTDAERKAIGFKTEKRVRSLVERANVAETKLKEFEPLVEQGKAFSKVIDTYKLDADLAHVEDAQVAGHIKFQAAINRAFSKSATREDVQFIQSQFAALDRVREHFGLSQPTPSFDASEIEKAVEAIKKDFDFTSIDALVAKLKTTKKAEAPPQPEARVEQPQQRQPQVVNRDTQAYSSQLQRELKTSGVADVNKYMAEKLWPSITAELQQTFPGEDAVQAYNSLSPRAQFDMALRAHQDEQKKAEALKTTETAPRRPATKPVTGSKSNFSETPTASSATAAIRFFSGTKE